MPIVCWPVGSVQEWLAQQEALLALWPKITGRICPVCGVPALQGHGRRKRQVHVIDPNDCLQCKILRLLVQRVRCRKCKATRTLLPGFLAPWQRHSNRVREAAVAGRAEGASWRALQERLRLPMFSTASLRRWVARVWERLPGVRDFMIRYAARRPATGVPRYAPVWEAESWQAFRERVAELWRGEPDGWLPGETLSAADAWCGRHGCPLFV